MWGSSKKQKKVYSGTLDDCSVEQTAALQQFRLIVRKLDNDNTDSKWDDTYLLRFLRARKFSVDETAKMWTKFIEWRKEKDVDNSMYFKFPELTNLRRDYPHGYHKVDRKFRPIYIERVGFINVDKIFSYTTPERLLQYYTLLYENLLTTIFDACTEMKKRQTGEDGRVTTTCTILDLKDMSLGMASKAYNFVKPVSSLAQDNYPQILGVMYIINAPFVFTGIWAIVKGWIDQKTKQKIKFLGSGYKKELLQAVAPENLPDFIDGGKCKCGGEGCLAGNVGPWNPNREEMFPYAVGFKNREQELKDIKQKNQKAQQERDELERKDKEEMDRIQIEKKAAIERIDREEIQKQNKRKKEQKQQNQKQRQRQETQKLREAHQKLESVKQELRQQSIRQQQRIANNQPQQQPKASTQQNKLQEDSQQENLHLQSQRNQKGQPAEDESQRETGQEQRETGQEQRKTQSNNVDETQEGEKVIQPAIQLQENRNQEIQPNKDIEKIDEQGQQKVEDTQASLKETTDISKELQ